MIVDLIANWKQYPLGPAWEKAFLFLQSVKPDAEETFYWIDEKNIYARVMSYETVEPDQAKMEAHHQYIDIQSPLIFSEGIAWHPAEKLEIKTEYNHEKDVYFLEPPQSFFCKVDLYPGLFAFFAPKDAHMPKLIAGSKSEVIKKVVVKIKTELLNL